MRNLEVLRKLFDIKNYWKPKPHGFEYDLMVIGGGSGGISAAKTAAKLGKKVVLFDYVQPTPLGTKWGLGGTCTNVGCIPKKLMHQAANLHLSLLDSTSFGWQIDPAKGNHDWATLVSNIQNYIQSSNFAYRVALMEGKVRYINSFAKFVDRHTVEFLDRKTNSNNKLSAANIVICVGGRPRYLHDTPGGSKNDNLCITSDDLFSLANHPGKTLCVGASYISLECAGFLSGLGVETTILARGGLLGRFDRDIAKRVGIIMKEHGTRILQGYNLLEIRLKQETNPRELVVVIENSENGETMEFVFNTVVLAVGREPALKDLNLSKAGVKLHKRSKKILVNRAERTSVSNIFAIGDCVHDRPELTPPAIRAGYLLSHRLFGDSREIVNYRKIPTTIFTPIEYGCIGLSEEDAIRTHGAKDIEVYHMGRPPIEFALSSRDKSNCYSKLITLKSDGLTEKELVVGFHYLGPNAGEVTQGFGLAMKMNATKQDFDSLMGIHPTSAEVFTELQTTKSSGEEYAKTSC